MRNLPSLATMGSGGDDPTVLPRMTVTGERINDSNFSASFESVFVAVGTFPGDMQDHETLEPGDEPLEIPDEQQLAMDPQFQDLPDEVQELVLASSSATTQLLNFFEQGGKIAVVADLDASARYLGGEPPTIVLNGNMVDMASLGSNTEYGSGILVMSIAHELGHFVTASTHTWQGGTAEDYYGYRAEKEALAIINEWNIGSEIEAAGHNVQWSSYGDQLDYQPLFTAYNNHGDLDTLLNDIANVVRNYTPLDGIGDVNGDGTIDMADQWKQDWDDGYR